MGDQEHRTKQGSPSQDSTRARESTQRRDDSFGQPYGNAAMQEALLGSNPQTESEIEICKRVAELPGAQELGFTHWWIRTKEMEAGMGPATGEVPAVDGDKGDLPYSSTTVNDHTGQGDLDVSVCVPAEEWNPEWSNVDINCVDERSELGTPTGPWTPFWNDCHDWVETTMNDCDPDVQETRQATPDRETESYERQRFLETTHPGRY
jgi:hypothetical protein